MKEDQDLVVIAARAGGGGRAARAARRTRIEPATSVPTPSAEPPTAISAASPPDEPPGLRDASYGLSAQPQIALSDSGIISSCGTFVRTKGIAPAARSTLTRTASASAGWPQRAARPHVASKPASLMLSFTETGSPWSGPRSAPAARSASHAAAAATARAKSSCAVAHSSSPARIARATRQRMTYSLENFLRAKPSSSAVAVSAITSVGFTFCGFALHHCSRPFSSNSARAVSRAASRLARVAAATAASRRCVDAARTRRTSANAT